MAILLKEFKYHDKDFQNVTMRVLRVYGSKSEGWSCVFGWTDTTWDPDNLKGSLPFNVPYTEQNPVGCLYEGMTQYLRDKGFDPQSDESIVAVLNEVVTEENIVPADEEQLERIEKLVKPKKPRKKKGE